MIINSNILGFTDDLSKSHESKWYVNEKQVMLCFVRDRVPTFQFSIYSESAISIDSVKLVDEQGNESDVTSELNGLGLQVLSNGNYQTVKYLSYSNLAGSYGGVYRIHLTLSGTTYYSNLFTLVDEASLLGKVKIEWWHNEILYVPEGFFTYTYPFKFSVYLDTDIARPSYQFEKDVATRNTKEFPLYRASYKVYKFSVLLPEFMIDALRLIPIHDNVEITYNNTLFDVDTIEMQDPVWLDVGDLATVNFEFRAGTVVSSGGYASVDSYDDVTCECMTTVYQAETLINENSREYSNKRYFNIGLGSMVDFVEGDYVIVNSATTGNNRLYQLDNSLNYVLISLTEGMPVCDKNNSTYYFAWNYTLHQPIITDVDDTDIVNALVTAQTFPGTQNILYGKLQNGTIEEIGTYPYSDLKDTITVDLTDYVAIQIKPQSASCLLGWSQSEWYQVQCYGIGCMVIGSTFTIA